MYKDTCISSIKRCGVVYVSASHTVQWAMGNTLFRQYTSIPCLICKIKCICVLLILGDNTMSNVDYQAAFYKYCIQFLQQVDQCTSHSNWLALCEFVWKIAGQNHAFSNFFNIDSGIHWPQFAKVASSALMSLSSFISTLPPPPFFPRILKFMMKSRFNI